MTEHAFVAVTPSFLVADLIVHLILRFSRLVWMQGAAWRAGFRPQVDRAWYLFVVGLHFDRSAAAPTWAAITPSAHFT